MPRTGRRQRRIRQPPVQSEAQGDARGEIETCRVHSEVHGDSRGVSEQGDATVESETGRVRGDAKHEIETCRPHQEVHGDAKRANEKRQEEQEVHGDTTPGNQTCREEHGTWRKTSKPLQATAKGARIRRTDTKPKPPHTGPGMRHSQWVLGLGREGLYTIHGEILTIIDTVTAAHGAALCGERGPVLRTVACRRRMPEAIQATGLPI